MRNFRRHDSSSGEISFRRKGAKRDTSASTPGIKNFLATDSSLPKKIWNTINRLIVRPPFKISGNRRNSRKYHGIESIDNSYSCAVTFAFVHFCEKCVVKVLPNFNVAKFLKLEVLKLKLQAANNK